MQEGEQNTILCYEPVGQAVVTREETQEAIVPDACPDMLRIADVCAQILTERREPGDGQARVSGCVRATVLYVPMRDVISISARRKTDIGIVRQ